MQAAICTAYGGPETIEVREVPAPEPGRGEVLIRVHASTVTSADCRVRAANFPSGFALPARLMFGLTRPRQPILGTELSGVVAATGAGVEHFRAGDEVFALTGARMGCHAGLAVMSADAAIAPKPKGLMFEEAATLAFGGTTALYFLRDLGKVKPGERVLINGASGAVGVAAVQLARHFGAHVTGVTSGPNRDLVTSLGAHEVIDYTALDFARIGATWDIILDTVGTAPFARSAPALSANGRLLIVLAGLWDFIKAPLQSKAGGKTVKGGTSPERGADLLVLKALAEAGALKPVIDSRFPLSRIREAHARADTNRKRGSAVITMTGEETGTPGG